GARSVQDITILGLFFGVASMLSSTLGSIFQKKLNGNLVNLATIQYFFTAIFYALVVVNQGWHVNWSLQFVSSVIWMTLAVSVIATLLFFYMISQEAVSRVNSILYLVPVCTIGLDAIVFGEKINITTLLGMLIVLYSVWIFGRVSKK
ncbi:MAG: DMT family transporter, partial [Polaromonas sp.]